MPEIVDDEARVFIGKVVATHYTTVFVTWGCAVCEDLISQLHAQKWPGVAAINLDTHCPSVRQALQVITGQTGVPNVWVNGKFVGGWDAMQDMMAERMRIKKNHL
jgi:glutaredoxin-related protein